MHNLEPFADVFSSSSEQHRDLRSSRLDRDLKYLESFIVWLRLHSSCKYTASESLVSLATGVIADSTVNCDLAYSIGKVTSESVTGQIFTTVQLKRKDKIISFSSSRNAARVRGQDVDIEPNILWHRLPLLISSNQEREPFFFFELAPEPTSLFKQGMMRKTQKSVIATIYKQDVDNVDSAHENAIYTIDVGYLLHKVNRFNI